MCTLFLWYFGRVYHIQNTVVVPWQLWYGFLFFFKFRCWNFQPKKMFQRKKERNYFFLVKVNEACFLKMFENIRVLTIKMLNLCDDMMIVHKAGFQCSHPSTRNLLGTVVWGGHEWIIALGKTIRWTGIHGSSNSIIMGGPAMGFDDHESRVCGIIGT